MCTECRPETYKFLILRKIASGHIEEVGDISTLADPSVVELLLKERL